MNGLEAIIDRILSEAKEKASDFEYAGEKQIKEIIEDSSEKSRIITEASREKAKKESESILKRAGSFAVSEKRKILLFAKQKKINEVLDNAVESLSKLSIEQKSDLYKKMLERIVADRQNSQEELTVRFNQQDYEIAENLLKTNSFPIKMNSKPGKFAGGFIVYKGNIEINMTFEMTVRQYRSELVAIAADSLFSEGTI